MNITLTILIIVITIAVIFLRLCKIEEEKWNDGICKESKLIWNLKFIDEVGARHYGDSLGNELTIFLTKIDLK